MEKVGGASNAPLVAAAAEALRQQLAAHPFGLQLTAQGVQLCVDEVLHPSRGHAGEELQAQGKGEKGEEKQEWIQEHNREERARRSEARRGAVVVRLEEVNARMVYQHVLRRSLKGISQAVLPEGLSGMRRGNVRAQHRTDAATATATHHTTHLK